MGQPRAITIGAAMLLVFAMVPGFPTLVFLALAALLSIPAVLAYTKIGRAHV